MKKEFIRSLANQFLDKVNESRIIEMAYSRKKAIFDIQALSKQIALHTVKLVAVEEDDNTKIHWAHEINTWLYNIEKIKKSTLTENDFFTMLWDEPFRHGDISINGNWKVVLSSSRGSLKRNRLSDSQVWYQLKSIYSYICHDLAYDNFDGLQKYILL